MMTYIKQALVEFWGTIGEMSPYLIFGFIVAGLLSVFLSQRFVERHLGGNKLWSIVKASLLGVPLPLCSCSVLPVATSLRQRGASKGSTISFLLSTPQTGVDSVLVTLALLGPVFAIVRPLVAFLTGIFGGALVTVVDTAPEDPKNEEEISCCCSGHGTAPSNRWLQAVRHAFLTLPRDIGKALLLGLLVAATLAVLVPDDFFAEHLGTGLAAKLVMMVLGIPVYVCATASVPLAAAMMLKGLTPGAALIFLMTGPATNAAGFATIWKAVGRRSAIAYMLAVALCALASGVLLDTWVQHTQHEIQVTGMAMLPAWVKNLSAVLLLGLIGYGFWSKRKAAKQVD
jgi:uncharacterized membrane protein YraQ (UPF0718 family)